MMISLKSLSGILLAVPFTLATTSSSVLANENPSSESANDAADLLSEPSNEALTPTNQQVNPTSEQDKVVQQQPRRRPPVTRQIFRPNYLGLGLNIGIDGETALGDTNFAINSRVQLSQEFSFRPGAVIGDDAAFLLPVTFDFPTSPGNFSGDGPPLLPYIGGGVLLSTRDEDDNVGGLATAGVDLPLSREFTANAGLNVGFIGGETDWGLLLGVGYNLPNN